MSPLWWHGDGVICKGHGRRAAAIRMGLALVPIIVRTDLTPEQVRASRLADNKTAESAWDTVLLGPELRWLREEAPALLPVTGFSGAELDLLLADPIPAVEPQCDEDETPAVQERVVSVTNDLWIMGRHRLLCSDSQGFFAAAAAAAAQLLVHRQIIWVKPSLVLGHGDYHWRHELCFYGWHEGHRAKWLGDRSQTTVWEVGRENDHIHPTQKPCELFERPMRFHTVPGDVCAEPFSGSGTQFIAAEKTGRRCFGMEIEPRYVDVIVRRWQTFTGQSATLSGDGRTFEEIAGERLAA